VPVGLVVAVSALLVWVPSRAEVYADLVEAAFDLYRGALYVQLRWPQPDNPRDERAKGRRLTTYLMRGLDDESPTFTAAPALVSGGSSGDAPAHGPPPTRPLAARTGDSSSGREG
jgi:hypothetical protein